MGGSTHHAPYAPPPPIPHGDTSSDAVAVGYSRSSEGASAGKTFDIRRCLSCLVGWFQPRHISVLNVTPRMTTPQATGHTDAWSYGTVVDRHSPRHRGGGGGRERGRRSAGGTRSTSDSHGPGLVFKHNIYCLRLFKTLRSFQVDA